MDEHRSEGKGTTYLRTDVEGPLEVGGLPPATTFPVHDEDTIPTTWTDAEGLVIMGEPKGRTYVIYRCPQCLEQIMESSYTSEHGRVWGHYHDPPEGWEGPEDPWFDAERIEVTI